jgi:hypothetical protein
MCEVRRVLDPDLEGAIARDHTVRHADPTTAPREFRDIVS